MFDKNYRLLGKHATYARFLKEDAKLLNAKVIEIKKSVE